jgi:hypothetical protein
VAAPVLALAADYGRRRRRAARSKMYIGTTTSTS